MGNIFCLKPTMASNLDRFDEEKTVKVSGVSQLLQDQITKEIQSDKRTGYTGDVSRLYVCPDGKDYVLVEFADNVTDEKVDNLNIGGTRLKVEKWNPQSESNENVEPDVSRIWRTDDQTSNDDGQPSSNGVKSTDNKKEHSGKAGRHDKFNERRPGLNSYREEPFSQATVKLNDEFAKKTKVEKEIEEMLKKEHVEHSKGKLTGTWSAINTVHQKLLGYIYGSVSDQSPISPKAVDRSPQRKPDDVLTVNSLFYRYIIAYHYDQLRNLENVSEEISFKMNKSEKELKVFAREDVDEERFKKTVFDFTSFYQDQIQKMYQEVILAPPHDAVLRACCNYFVVVDSLVESNKIVIYGEKDEVGKAKAFLESQGNTFNTDNTSCTGPPKGATAEGAGNRKLCYELSKDVNLVVYQGDLTQEKVDAIVNPANGRLEHGGGAALAIVKAGGRSIQDESYEIMKRRRYRDLQPGEVAITGSGKLPCKFVVHAVGPVWDRRQKDVIMQQLYTVVYNSLGIACQHHATNISIPAISSGVYKVPLEVCVQALFNAVVDFTKHYSSVPLKEIRFVNIDNSTNRIFAKEMEKRFGGFVKREQVEGSPYKDNKQQDRQNGLQYQLATRQSKPSPSRSFNPAGQTSHDSQGHHYHQQSGSTNSTANPPDKKPSKALYSVTAAVGKKIKGNPGANDPAKAGADGKASKDDECCICLSEFTNKKTLDKCGHSFCTKCIQEAFKTKKTCPICNTVYGPLTGNQPEGKMYDSCNSTRLPGYGSCGTITISYRFPHGIQGPDHPNPGKPYTGTSRDAYLPDNKEGRKVLKLLKKAFEQKLTFTIGRSTTTGMENVVTWNDIHHKTSPDGGATGFGYPDPDYLKRVQEELAAKGITA